MLENPSCGEVKSPKGDNAARIAAVNHWRGQCLDNFARVEFAIITASEKLRASERCADFKLEEAARNRTRVLAKTLADFWPKVPEARSASTLLDCWSIREKERNALVHGRFTVRQRAGSEWILINETLVVKRGVALADRSLLDSQQAASFLKAIISERKQLEAALDAFCEAELR